MLKILDDQPFIHEGFLWLITDTGRLYRRAKQQENSFFLAFSSSCRQYLTGKAVGNGYTHRHTHIINTYIYIIYIYDFSSIFFTLSLLTLYLPAGLGGKPPFPALACDRSMAMKWKYSYNTVNTTIVILGCTNQHKIYNHLHVLGQLIYKMRTSCTNTKISWNLRPKICFIPRLIRHI